MAECRTCEAGIIWAVTARGRAMPLDAEPVEDWESLRGLLVLRDGIALPATGNPPVAGEHVYRSHFATCPQADTHRVAS